ncbi:MAG: hypothetical protein ACK4P3_05120, partial [Fimbriimonadaceae bacterium]
ADTSTLLNFLLIGRFDLLRATAERIGVVDAVIDEVETHKEDLSSLLESGVIEQITLKGDKMLSLLARFTNKGMGDGETFSFTAAVLLESAVAIDDKAAIKKAKSCVPELKVLETWHIVC